MSPQRRMRWRVGTAVQGSAEFVAFRVAPRSLEAERARPWSQYNSDTGTLPTCDPHVTYT